MLKTAFAPFPWRLLWTKAVRSQTLSTCQFHVSDQQTNTKMKNTLHQKTESYNLLSCKNLAIVSKSHIHFNPAVFGQKRGSPIQSKKSRPFLVSFYHNKENMKANFKKFLSKYSMASLVNKAPESVKPYLYMARVDKPTGTFLLYIPCLYGICFATPPGELPSLYYIALFGVGSFLMRGAGCVINDLWDKDFDRQVERTKSRPIAAGKISEKNAIKFLAAQLTLSLGILLSLNPLCILIGVASMGPVIAYPLAKRYTMVPQAALGLTFNVGALMGYAAVAPSPDWLIMLTLYGSCFMWTMYYDTIYAFQDVDDDQKAGVKSVALLFQKYSDDQLREMPLHERLKEHSKKQSRIRLFLFMCGGMHMATMALTGFQKYVDGPFYLALIITSVHMFCQVVEAEVDSKEFCWNTFNENRNMGLILALGIVLSIWMQKKKPDENEKLTVKK